jgi:hypothetical protein
MSAGSAGLATFGSVALEMPESEGFGGGTACGLAQRSWEGAVLQGGVDTGREAGLPSSFGCDPSGAAPAVELRGAASC